MGAFTNVFANLVGKLTWAPTPSQRVALSYIGMPYWQGNQANGRSEPSAAWGETRGTPHNAVLNYQGKFFGKRLQVEAMAGYYRWDAEGAGRA